MKPLWKISSGHFAGWLLDGNLYDANGRNVGWEIGGQFYSLDGNYIGELFDEDWVGKRPNISYPAYGARTGCAGIAVAAYAGRAGLSLAGWEDPDF